MNTALTELLYSNDRRGPFKLYVYEPNSEYHRGGVWFEKEPKYPDEELTISQAFNVAFVAMSSGLEVRVCDSGDMLVFHAKDNEVLYPPKPQLFWEEIA